MKKQDTFDRYEQLPVSYHEDPRWKDVEKLRKENKFPESNDLALQIRTDYGFEY
jgi:hypothetical protein